MAALISRRLLHKLSLKGIRCSTVAVENSDIVNKEVQIKENEIKSAIPDFSTLAEYRFIYPEFLPDPQMDRRHKIREKLERMDMLKRRSVVDIPEFYVGSILAVTISDCYAPGKTSRFVGICIFREGHGLRSNFVLRNVIDHQGVEIMYELYNPTILSVEVLKLEKRLDYHLMYLRDALPEYCTFPLDMEPESRAEGMTVPVNPIKVKLKPPPWYARWERMELKGVQEFVLPQEVLDNALKRSTPWEKYDLMKEYRKHIPEEHQVEIWQDVHQHHTTMNQQQRKDRRKRQLLKARKD